MRFWRIVGLVIAPFFIPAFYRDVARNWGGIGLLYLLLLFTIAWIPNLIRVHMWAQKVAQVDFPPVAKKVPDVTVKNGKVSSPVAQPFEIKDEQTGKVIFVLDTTGKIKNLEQTEAMFLVTETKIFQRDPQTGQIQIHDLAQAQFPDFELSPDVLQEWVDFGSKWLALSAYPIVMICSLIRALVIMFLASIAGLICNSIAGTGVTFGGLLRLGAVGLTTSVYIDMGMDIAHWFELTTFEIPMWFAIALGITCIYVAFGVFVAGPPPMPEGYDDRDRDRRDRVDDRGYDDDDYSRPRRRAEGDGGPHPDDGGFKR